MLGLQLNYITSESMEPHIMTGQKYLINKKVKYEDIKIGDVISYKIQDRYITHRVVDKDRTGLVTKGDNNTFQDIFQVGEKDYIGKVVCVLPFYNKRKDG